MIGTMDSDGVEERVDLRRMVVLLTYPRTVSTGDSTNFMILVSSPRL